MFLTQTTACSAAVRPVNPSEMLGRSALLSLGVVRRAAASGCSARPGTCSAFALQSARARAAGAVRWHCDDKVPPDAPKYVVGGACPYRQFPLLSRPVGHETSSLTLAGRPPILPSHPCAVQG
jgi:hypothetical protein